MCCFTSQPNFQTVSFPMIFSPTLPTILRVGTAWCTVLEAVVGQGWSSLPSSRILGWAKIKCSQMLTSPQKNDVNKNFPGVWPGRQDPKGESRNCRKLEKDENGKFFQVKSTYVETIEQEKFLRNMPKALDDRIVQQVRHGDVLCQGPIDDPLWSTILNPRFQTLRGPSPQSTFFRWKS